MNLKVITAPTVEPISLEEAKLFLRVDHDEEDDLIEALIGAARGHCEDYQRRTIAETTYQLTLDEFPKEKFIKLPNPPLKSVLSVTYTDEEGTVNTFSTDNYIVDSDSEPGRIALKEGKEWATDTLQPVGGVKIQFTAGYGTGLIPKQTLQAMKMLVGLYYENREAYAIGNVAGVAIPFGVDALLWGHRSW